MELAADQLRRLAALSDEWLDLSAPERSATWLDEAAARHPDLAAALQAMLRLAESQTLNGPPGFAVGEDFAADQQIGPYRLVRLLGRGGMGAVWLARQSDGRMHRDVALKLPLPDLATGGWRRRFERERDIQAALDHPGIAKIFDAGVTPEGQPFLAMQYVQGRTLTQYCQEHRLDLVARLRLFVELLGAVQHAHAALVVHRDLKPGNILVDDAGRVVLLDFGIAKVLQAADGGSNGQTELAGRALTLDYASPEQITGQGLGTGSDIYSLGVVLYELLAGRRPYRLRRSSRAELEEAVLEQELIAPSAQVQEAHAAAMGQRARALSRQLRGDLDAVVGKALRKRSDERYATAQAFADDLQRWLRKEPVSAQPDALGYRARRLLARRWRELSLAAVVLTSLIGASVVALVQAREATAASAKALNEARQSQAVTQFIRQIFFANTNNQNDPVAARQQTSRQLLEQAAARVETELKDAPAQQVELMDLIASLYGDIHEPALAEAMRRKALAQSILSFGPDDLRTLQQEVRLAFLDVQENRDISEALLKKLQPRLPQLARSADKAERLLAIEFCNLLLNRDFELNAESALPVAAITEPLLDSLGDDEASGSHHMLGVILLENMRLADAERHFRKSYAFFKARGMRAAFADSYATWYGRQQQFTGHYAHADELIREGYAMERHNDSGDQRPKDWNLARYARFLADTGQAAKALQWLDSGGPLASPTVRDLSLKAMRPRLARAHALVRLGRLEEALELARSVDAELQDVVPPLDKMDALLSLGRLDEALSLIDSQEPRVAQGRGSNYGREIAFQRMRALLAQGKPEAARSYLEEHRRWLAPEGVGPIERARVDWIEAGIAAADPNPAAARDIARLALSRLDAAAPESAPYLREWRARLQDRLADALLALGDRAAARQAFDAALAAYTQLFDAQASLDVGRVEAQLARLDTAAGDTAGAKRHQARADAIAARHPTRQGWGA